MVSVIVPVYNEEKYLESCLNSICNQTYTDIEVIVVDDGSEDRSRDIIQKYAFKDRRVIYYFNENHGVSYSRNFAMNHCNGEYVTFIDADDLVAPDFIETLMTNIREYDADMSAVNVVKKKDYEEGLYTSGEIIIFEEEEMISQLFGVYEGFLCNKLYKKSIFYKNNIFLDNSIGICEDLLFNILYLRSCQKVVYNTSIKYFYRQAESSALNRMDNWKWFDFLKAYQKILELLNEYPNVMIKASANYMLFLCEAMYRIKTIPFSNKTIEDEIKIEWKNVKRVFRYFSVKQKIKICVFKYFPSIVMKYRRRKL